MNTSSTIGENYICLALQINRHLDGFVDAYFGSPALKESVDASEMPTISQLQDEVANLSQSIANAEMDRQRQDYLARQATAMTTVLRRLAGEALSLVKEVEGCFDIRPERVDESQFEAALQNLDAILPGAGNLAARYNNWNKQFELRPALIMPTMNTALAEARQRTIALFELPADETVDLKLVSNEPWIGYNWYLGNAHSRIEINTDLSVQINNVLDLMAHEVYPGHHTEHAIKETRWYLQHNRPEHSIQLLLAPESTVAEAIATTAQEVIFPDEADLAHWLSETLYPAAGISVDVEQDLHIRTEYAKLTGATGNVAFMLHEDGATGDEIIEYLQTYSLRSRKRAEQNLKFISNPVFRAYTFNYSHGKRMLKQAFKRGEMIDVFRWAVSQPVTPTAIVRYGV